RRSLSANAWPERCRAKNRQCVAIDLRGGSASAIERDDRRNRCRLSQLSIQCSRTTPLRLFLERLLRSVCRIGENGNLRRRHGTEEIRVGRDGHCALNVSALASSVHAAHHRGALVGARFGEWFNSIRVAANPNVFGGCGSDAEATACSGHLRDGPSWPQSSGGSQASIQQKDTFYFTHKQEIDFCRNSDHRAAVKRRRHNIGSEVSNAGW